MFNNWIPMSEQKLRRKFKDKYGSEIMIVASHDRWQVFWADSATSTSQKESGTTPDRLMASAVMYVEGKIGVLTPVETGNEVREVREGS